MKVSDSAKDLVQEDLDVVGGEVLRRHDDLVQVRLHQLRDHVDLLEEVQMRRLKVGKLYWNIGTIELKQKKLPGCQIEQPAAGVGDTNKVRDRVVSSG